MTSNVVAFAHTHENGYYVMSKLLLFSCFSGQEILTGVITTLLLVIVLTLILLFFFLIVFVIILTYKELLKVVNNELFLCFGEYLGHLEKHEGDCKSESA